MEGGNPDWLDKTFFSTALQGGENKMPKVTIVNFTVKSALLPGSNYTSHIYRAHVEYKTGESSTSEFSSLIVKLPIGKGFFDESSDKLDFFGKEPKIYRELLPMFQEKIKCSFAPQSFHCPIERGLVLEDLLEEGYTVPEKYVQLDYTHCKLVLSKLAKFHATSVSVCHENLHLVESVCEEAMFINDGPLERVTRPWVIFCFKTIAGILKDMQLVSFAELILSRVGHIWESAVKMCKAKEKGFNVFNHGDFSIINMLFKETDSCKVTDVKFIDFQFTRIHSPVLDIIYFIWISANNEVRENKLQDLYEVYLQTLNSTLDELGCEERLSAEQFNEDITSSYDWALLVICFFLPNVMAEPENAVNLEENAAMDFENEKTKEIFTKPLNGRTFRRILPNMMKQVYAWIYS